MISPSPLLWSRSLARSLFIFPFLCSNVARLCVFFLFYSAVCAGGRGVVVGPIVSQTLSDVLCVNEYGPNFLFRNKGDGTFTDVAQQAGMTPSPPTWGRVDPCSSL